MKIHTKDFRVAEEDQVNLKKWPTRVDPIYKSRHQYKKLLEDHVAQLSAQQQLLYADNRHAVLLIFQAIDAAGKDDARPRARAFKRQILKIKRATRISPLRKSISASSASALAKVASRAALVRTVAFGLPMDD